MKLRHFVSVVAIYVNSDRPWNENPRPPVIPGRYHISVMMVFIFSMFIYIQCMIRS